MYVVAITELGNSAAGLGELAGDLGTTLYELKLTFGAGLPAIVLSTVDASAADRAVSTLRRHGHRATVCDRRNVVPSSAMIALRDFQLAPDAVLTGAPGERLRYDDILALLRATHRTEETHTREEKQRKLRPGMAIVTGGLVSSKTTQRQVTTTTEHREPVLYLFPRGAGMPWILRERTARYMGLGAELRPTSLENFATTTRRLRELAPLACYDERLQSGRSIRGVAAGIAAIDLLAHLIVAELG